MIVHTLINNKLRNNKNILRYLLYKTHLMTIVTLEKKRYILRLGKVNDTDL